jgi:hypothetical protein
VYRKGQHGGVPTIDFDDEAERDRFLQVMALVHRLGGPEGIESLVDSERSGTADLNEVARKMRELREKLQRDHRGERE